MTTSIEIEMDNERDARLAELTAEFAAVSGPMQGVVLAFLAAVHEVETRQGEAIVGLEQEKATRDLRIEALSAANADLQGTIAVLALDNNALRAERESILRANCALLAEREAFRIVEDAMAAFREKRRATETVLAASSPEHEAGQSAVEAETAGREIAAGVLGELGCDGALDNAERDAGVVSVIDRTATDSVDVVFRLTAALVDEMDRVVGTGRFASRDALVAATVSAGIAPGEVGAAAIATAAGRVDRTGRTPGKGTIQS